MTTPTGFRALLGLDVIEEESGDGVAVVVVDADERHLNPYGTVHGGAIATLVDVAMGGAVAAAGADAPVTIELKLTYLEPGQPGRLRAEAKVRKRGRRLTIVEAEVTQDGEVVALALGTFTS
jgi:acyl-CoA thioesterase